MNTCERCQGRMVEDYGSDQLACNWTKFYRCINCGEIVDSVILMNRKFKYDDLKDRPCKDKLKKAYSDFVRKEGQGLCLQQPGSTIQL